MLIGGVLANALAFTGSSYLFHRLSADNIDAERKRHDATIEALQKAQIEWAHKHQERIDFINPPGTKGFGTHTKHQGGGRKGPPPNISRTRNATNLKPLEGLGVSFKVSKNFKLV